MANRCSICNHPQIEGINQAVVAGVPFRKIVEQYGTCSIGALHRHKSHLPVKLVKAQEAKEVAQADSLLARLFEINKETIAILHEARESPRGQGVALLAIARVEKQIELQAKLLGELKDGPQVSVHLDQQWVLIEKCIIDALAPFPEARLAVAEALKKVGNGN